jgi:DNA polymerase III sliding clamp (beta) subunit (PCNA family)
MYSKKISENDTVKLFKGKDYLFLKVNDELYSTFFKDIKYASFERAIPYNQPYKAEFSSNELRDFVDSCKQDTNGFDFTFENGQLSLHSTKNKKVISCTYNCEEGFSLRLSVKNAVALTNFYKEKIILEMKESASAVKIDTDNLLTVFMPMKQNV